MADERTSSKEMEPTDLPGFGPVVASYHDGLGNYLKIDGPMRSVVGMDADDLLGQSAAQFVDEKDMAVVADAFEAAWSLRRPVRLLLRTTAGPGSAWITSRFELIRKDGADQFVAYSRATHPPADGQARFFLE